MIELSIIIPVYKTEKYLRECVDSVLREAPKDSEIILVDDGSPDNCPQICDEYAKKDNRVYVIHQKNCGLSAARNAGIDLAKGKKLFFLDSDDYLGEGYFNTILLCEEDLIIGNYCAFYSDQSNNFGALKSCVYPSVKSYLTDFHKYFATIFNFAWGKLYETSIIRQYNLRFDEKLSMVEDVLFNIKYYEYCQTIRMVDEAVVFYRQSRQTLSKQYSLALFQWYCNSYEKIKELLEKQNIFTKENKEHFYVHFIGNTLECLIGSIHQEKFVRRKHYSEICENWLLQTALPYNKSKKISGIVAALKKKNIKSLERRIKQYLFLLSIKKRLRQIYGIFKKNKK